MGLNTFFRFWWLIAAANIKFSGGAIFIQKIEVMVIIGMMVEAVRRTIWAILRVENEFHNNLE